MNLLIPAAAFGAYYLLSMKDTGERLRKCEISSFKLGKIQLGLQQTTIPVELQVFNPNNTDVPAEYFRGIVSRAGKKIADFTFDSQGKSVMLKRGTTTPLIFNVRITTLGIVTNLVGLFKSMVAAQPFETTFTVNGILRINGFDIPVNFNWDAKAGKAVKPIAGIGKPYAKIEFANNEEMQTYFRKPCTDTKFSLNGIPDMGIGAINNQNFHVLKISFVGQTDTKDARVKITSERFKESVTIPFGKNYDNTKDVAINWLDKKGFNIIGAAEGKDWYYIISDTFQSLKQK